MKTHTSPALRIVAINFFMMLAFQATYFVGVIGCATYVLGAGAAQTSALVLIINVVLVLGNFLVGPLIDRLGPRRVILCALLFTSAIGFVGWRAPVSYPELVLIAAGIGLAFGAGTTAVDAYPRYFSEDADELARMNGLNQTATGVSVIAGPALAGWIATWAPQQCVFSLLALAPLPGLVVTWLTVEDLPVGIRSSVDPANAAGAGGGFAREVFEGVRIVFGRPELRVLFLIGFLGFFCYGAFDSLESLFYRDVLQVGSDWMGWLSSISGIGGTLGSLLVLRIPKKRFSTWLLAVALLVVGAGSMIYTGTPFVLVAAVGQVVTGVGFGALSPIRTTLTQQRCEAGVVGRVSSVMRVGMNSAGTLPLIVSPFLAEIFGVQGVLFGASTLSALIGLYFVARFRRACK
ncbi:MFS transporter [Paratractidigestivibacter sp.]|uniref:MFS transporter n=1 Tax=Paratractidigestivibacter sp. TaxID=2847316 RepID=UPI002AC90FB4|nr:MFS transporter [Paratractidigestivibacter sp.]